MSAPLLELSGICKRFPGVVALDHVDFAIKAGEVVSLIGENGAGKSTLMKIIGGVHAPDEGEIRIEGRSEMVGGVADAVRLGIGFVHQELNNVDNLDVGANIFLGREPRWGGPLSLVNRGAIRRESVPYLLRLGLEIDPGTPLRNLSLAQQQLVEIAKALSQRARLLVLDEPTSSLTQGETGRLLKIVKDLRNEGVSVIYISHRLGEVGEISDRVVGLRDGRNAGELPREQVTHDSMVRLMVGRDLRDFYIKGRGGLGAKRLEVRHLRTAARRGETVSFEIAAGEILGFAGLVGAGRSEVAQAIFGVDPPLEGEILLDGKRVRLRGARDAIRSGIYLVPEDRRRTGLITDMTVRENISLPAVMRNAIAGLVNRGSERRVAQEQVAELRIKATSVEAKARNLSGGNQQKVVLGKWLSLGPKVLIVDEPTRGIDVGAKSEIYALLRRLADEGLAVMVISSDMEEILGICDRIAVMHEGRIAGILGREEFSEEAVMNLAVGRPTAAPGD
ncbi:MAG TPA: sugar ABC transporter ATP-binding protein [Phycisphaerae bacterium]|nr:sugar ABC transporter ATP-binding protein [Phycisphaerae bacterium]